MDQASPAIERTPQTPPVIPAVAEGVKRPVWSVMIPVFNCNEYIPDALRSVLAQDPGPELMQIEVVDDGSTDTDVRKLVQKIGKGRVGYYKQPKNVGSLRNFETCINRSTGQFIHMLHGDDMVKSGFYKAIGSLFEEFPSIGAAVTKYTHIDEAGVETPPGAENISSTRGIIDNWLEKIASGPKLQPPAIVVRRSVYEHLGSYYGVHYGEDWEMYIRIAAYYPVGYTPECLSLYRIQRHRMNLTSQCIATGQNFKDVMKVIELAQAYLPPEKKERIARIARRTLAKRYSAEALRIYRLTGKLLWCR